MAAARLELEGELRGLIVSAQAVVRPPAVDAALAQAQKLQAVGQLAGGVAHDFNNLLTVIIGFADLLLGRHGEGDPSHGDIVQIRGTANRGVGLVRQLLAFSRQQAADPTVIDPAAAIAKPVAAAGAAAGAGHRAAAGGGRGADAGPHRSGPV